MSDADPAPTADRLAAERRTVLARLAALRGDFDDFVAASGDSNADDEHDPEGATIAFERAQVSALIRAAGQRLEEIDAALARLAEGAYGVCTACGEPIDPARLEVRPAARTCVACATR